MTFKSGDQVQCPNGLIGTVMDASDTPYIAPRGSVHVRFNCGLCDTIRLVDLRRLSSIQIREPWQTPLVLQLAADPLCPAEVLRDSLLKAGCPEDLVKQLMVHQKFVTTLQIELHTYPAGTRMLVFQPGNFRQTLEGAQRQFDPIARWLRPYLTRLADMASSEQPT